MTLKALPETVAKSGRAPNGRLGRDKSGTTFASEEFGLEVADISGDEAETFKGFEGVVIRQVDEGGPAAKKGLQPGMLIRSVNKMPLKNVEQFAESMKKVSPNEGVLLLVRTANGNRYVVLQKA